MPIKGNINSKKYCQMLHDLIPVLDWFLFLIPVLDWFCPEGDYVFVQDNTPIHSSAETSKWMEDRRINASEWPPQPVTWSKYNRKWN